MGRKVGFRYRCSRAACQARHTFPRRLEEYVRAPRCRCCGGRQFRLDKYRQGKGPSEGRKVCYCDGAHYPHRRGSVILCRHHPTGPTPEQWAEIHGERWSA